MLRIAHTVGDGKPDVLLALNRLILLMSAGLVGCGVALLYLKDV